MLVLIPMKFQKTVFRVYRVYWIGGDSRLGVELVVMYVCAQRIVALYSAAQCIAA
jgi:hypothetical protein